MKWIPVTLVCVYLASLAVCDEPNRNNDPENDHQQRRCRIAELDPTMAGKEVTVRFSVARLQGVAQRGKIGQSPTFIIETEPDAQTENRLTVWIVGDLTNVLHRLQMAFLQENQLKAGVKIEATGTLGVHQMDSHSFSIDVGRWQDFRIIPADGNGLEEPIRI